jgi:hypothetical protein
LPEGSDGLLVGPEGSPEAAQWIKEHYKSIEGDIFTKRFGKPSFIQKYLPGVISAEGVEVSLTNWAIDERKFSLVPAGETAAAAQTRIANQQACRAAITQLENLWRLTYDEAFKIAAAKASASKGFEKVRAERNRDLYRHSKETPPTMRVNVNRLNTSAQCDGAKMTPLFRRPKAYRLAFFRTLFTRDHLASHLQASRLVVDVQ